MPRKSRPRPTEPPKAVVGLGASAGGIAALQRFFSSVDPGLNVAYAVVLHLSPDHESKLAEVLQTVTTMPVASVTGEVALAGRSIYVVSPNNSLTVVEGKLKVTGMTRAEQRRSPVDIFFRTLADAYGARAICVVLSGTGPNGSNGLKRVKENGGLAMAQDPAEAEYGDMPNNSIATGLVDHVLPVSAMVDTIAAYLRRLSEPDAEAQASGEVENASDTRRDVLNLLRMRVGHDFSNYKPATIQRRIERRMSILNLATLGEYAQAIRELPDEPAALMNELLISVTNFFRDPEAFLALEQRILPRLFDGKRPHEHVRVWVAGCATGEEAYSIAMLLAEAASSLLEAPSIQVFATDLDHRAIAVAREGFYSAVDIADVTEERLKRFFQSENGGYRVRRELREMVLFADHNLIKDPPFSHLDLISCRNLLIYLNRSIQDRILETFHFALQPGGFLFLGTSESPEGSSELFLTVDKNAHIYQSRSAASRVAIPLADTGLLTAQERTAARPAIPRQPDRLFAADLHHRLLEQYAPPSVVISDEHNVVHVSEAAAGYLKVAPGEPSRDLLKLVRQELQGDLRTALHQAARQRTSVAVRGVRLEGSDAHRLVNITVRPVLREGDPARGFFLVLFDETPPNGDSAPPMQLASSLSEPVARQLEDELTRVKAQLRATVEQYETQVEEAKATNEELQAMNEELRSAAEELETSKEELQSVNEELTTVNQELKIKIEELGLTNNDFQNLINSTNVGTVFLDRALRVKMSTPGIQEIFNLRPTDTGRPLSDLTSRLKHDTLHRDIQQVLNLLHTIERDVESLDGRWYMMRIFPYRTVDDRIDGVVLTFQDVSEQRRQAQNIRHTDERLRLLMDSAIDYFIFTMTLEGVIDSWSSSAERVFGYKPDEVVGKHFEILFTPEDRASGAAAAEVGRAAREGRADDERWHVRKDGSRVYCSGVTTRLSGEHGSALAKIARDLTSQQEAQLALHEAYAAMNLEVEQRTGALAAEVSQHAAAQEHVKRLLRKLVTSQEEQRARIARDLHDHLGQQLTALRLTLERHRDRCTEPDDEVIANAIEHTRTLDGEVDFLAWELRPAVLDDLGLAIALPRYVEEWSRHYGVNAQCHATVARGILSPESEITFYRIAQETLNNVLKHAHAAHVDVLLDHRDGVVTMTIEDDGVGFDPEAGNAEYGLGLAGMRERAALIGASLDIESAPTQGTTIFLRCPVGAEIGPGA